jgi:hypothetical protein
MTSIITLHPQHELKPGRYLLDREGRLHPDRYSGFIRAVAAVTVRCKPVKVIKAQGSGQTAQALKPERPPHPDRGNLRRQPAKKASPPPVITKPAKPAPRPSALRTKADGLALFDKVLDRVKEAGPARARRIEKPAPPLDAERYAAARERERQARVKRDAIKLPPMVRAQSAEACGICGASGRNGCDHYLPFEG